ncbi:hypothetical protein Ahy_B01g056892 [Arachis hypogaea]|uniref:Uncharacterized protein n=1 Tax=Arachis hypogaea TaxID=3818 RepID=A0A445AZU1_ARAHY|nr:hypothetical protein Ahy_B01g056892 [Arachis hypogaea]
MAHMLGVVVPKDEEFRIRIEYSSRQSIVAAIRSSTISRRVDYIVCESEPQTFYAKCKMFGCGYSDTQWEAHVPMGTISPDYSKLDSDTVAKAKKPLVEIDPSLKVKYIIVEVQPKFNYTSIIERLG